jgi:hypothetical protein
MSDESGSGELGGCLKGMALLSALDALPVGLDSGLLGSAMVASGVDEGGVGGRPRRYWLSYEHSMFFSAHVAHGFMPEHRAFFAYEVV